MPHPIVELLRSPDPRNLPLAAGLLRGFEWPPLGEAPDLYEFLRHPKWHIWLLENGLYGYFERAPRLEIYPWLDTSKAHWHLYADEEPFLSTADLPQMAIARLSGLRELRLRLTHCSSLSCFPLVKLHNLRHVDLNGNAFGRFPKQLAQLRKVEHLDLGRNELSAQALDGMGEHLQTSVRELVLTRNPIKFFPPSLLKMKNLHTLHLDKCPLREIDPRIAEIQTLEVLNLTYTRIYQLPKSLAELPNLRQIQLQRASGYGFDASDRRKLQSMLKDVELIF